MGQNERDRADEDVVIEIIQERDRFAPADRLTPRMEARRLIDSLDAARAQRERERNAIRRTSTPVDPADTLAFEHGRL